MTKQKKSYKHTLNLPTTTFSMRAHAAQKEPELRKRWHEKGLDAQYFAKEGKQTFTLHDGPPYANGHLHIGHVLNKVLKDIVVRSKKMAGYDVSFRPGWDCHGLPIELKVAQELGEGARTDQAAFKKACRAYAQKWVDTQEKEFKALGVWAEWDKPYKTMDYGYEATILRSLADFADQGFIERKGKTVPWCFSCETVLATAEIEYQDRKDPSCYITFPLSQQARSQCFASIDASITISALIWTTTPWTIPLNRAVVLHPHATYSVVKVSDTQAVIVGSDLVAKIADLLDIEGQVLATFASAELKGMFAQHPVVQDLQVPFIFDNGVSTSDGTACLHSAPGCGPEDYVMGVKNGLEIYSPLTSDGRYDETIKPAVLAGEKITDGQWWVLRALKESGNLLHKTSLKHSYPHCWRCRNGLMFRATDQWFCNLSKNNASQNALQLLDAINFIPEWGRNRLTSFIENRTEWCISRQRSWGVPIPALHDVAQNKVYTSKSFINKVADKVEKEGIEYWDRVSIEELKADGMLPEQLLHVDDLSVFTKEMDILDVWFDSGVSHAAVLQKEKLALPADLYLEGSDQHRGWFQSAVLTSNILHKKAPTKAILTHGFVLDKHGHKMSKSRGNVIDPQDMIALHGADGLRLWVASVDYERDVTISPELLKQTSEVYRKIRNTCRFLLSNLFDFSPADNAIPYDNLLALDAAALHDAIALNEKVMQFYKEYKFSAIVQVLGRYCATELSSFYLDMCKDRLYVEKGARRRSAQTVLHVILTILNRLIAPLIPHTAEDVFDALPYTDATTAHASIHLDTFYTAEAAPSYDEELWSMLKQLRTRILKAIEEQRALGVIKHSLEADVTLTFEEGGNDLALYKAFVEKLSENGESEETFMKEWCIVSRFTRTTAKDSSIHVVAAQGEKCPRCWHITQSDHEDGVCARCYPYTV